MALALWQGSLAKSTGSYTRRTGRSASGDAASGMRQTIIDQLPGVRQRKVELQEVF